MSEEKSFRPSSVEFSKNQIGEMLEEIEIADSDLDEIVGGVCYVMCGRYT